MTFARRVTVRSRERYDWGLLQMDYDRVLEMSDDRVARDYRAIYSGPDALDRQLGANTQRRIRILSTTLVPNETGRAVVHVERTTWKNAIDNRLCRRQSRCTRCGADHGTSTSASRRLRPSTGRSACH
jgi:type IV secretory pathway component VirB8